MCRADQMNIARLAADYLRARGAARVWLFESALAAVIQRDLDAVGALEAHAFTKEAKVNASCLVGSRPRLIRNKLARRNAQQSRMLCERPEGSWMFYPFL